MHAGIASGCGVVARACMFLHTQVHIRWKMLTKMNYIFSFKVLVKDCKIYLKFLSGVIEKRLILDHKEESFLISVLFQEVTDKKNESLVSMEFVHTNVITGSCLYCNRMIIQLIS